MATRCLIVVGDVVLYKHCDGYPDYMLPYLEEFAKWYTKRVEQSMTYFPHLLWQEEDAAAALIFYDQLSSDEHWRSLGKPEYSRPAPDIRPTSIKAEEALSGSDCMWEEYVYRIELREDLIWKVTVFEKSRGSINPLKAAEIDLARFLSRETLQRHPEFRRPSSPRVRAAARKLTRLPGEVVE